jgi:hypothetical protein
VFYPIRVEELLESVVLFFGVGRELIMEYRATGDEYKKKDIPIFRV